MHAHYANPGQNKSSKLFWILDIAIAIITEISHGGSFTKCYKQVFFTQKRGKIEKEFPPIKVQAQIIKSVVKSTIPRGQ